MRGLGEFGGEVFHLYFFFKKIINFALMMSIYIYFFKIRKRGS